VAKANRGRRGTGRANYGRAFKVYGAKRRKVGRPRKARRALTSAFTGVRQAAEPTPEPDDIEQQDSRADEAPDKE
jgi:hypothetical protein